MKEINKDDIYMDGFTYLIGQMKEWIEAKKLSELRDRARILGIHGMLEEDHLKEFRYFKRVIQGNKETVLFNDGSLNGLHVITFETRVENFGNESKIVLLTSFKE